MKKRQYLSPSISHLFLTGKYYPQKTETIFIIVFNKRTFGRTLSTLTSDFFLPTCPSELLGLSVEQTKLKIVPFVARRSP